MKGKTATSSVIDTVTIPTDDQSTGQWDKFGHSAKAEKPSHNSSTNREYNSPVGSECSSLSVPNSSRDYNAASRSPG